MSSITAKGIPSEQILEGKWNVHFIEKPGLGESFDMEIDFTEVMDRIFTTINKIFFGNCQVYQRIQYFIKTIEKRACLP